MNSRWSPLLTAVCLLICSESAMLAAPPSIEFELVTPQPQAQLSAQQWLRNLTELNVTGVRIRQARAGDRAQVETLGTASQPRYKVLGVLNQRNELELPGGRFSLGQQTQLRDWIESLKQHGPPGAPRKRTPFGLEAEQLKRLDAALSTPLDVEVKGLARSDAVAAASRRIALPIEIDARSADALQKAGAVTDSLRGLSCGTCLAALVRPAGLAVVPRAARNASVELFITRPQQGAEIWPVGFPAEERRQQLVPLLFESINVEIEANPLDQALEAIQPRLQIPFLVDHNALAAEQIDLQKSIVTLPAKKLSYSLILRKLLGQASLTSELRTDDAGKPFLWITSFRQLPRP